MLRYFLSIITIYFLLVGQTICSELIRILYLSVLCCSCNNDMECRLSTGLFIISLHSLLLSLFERAVNCKSNSSVWWQRGRAIPILINWNATYVVSISFLIRFPEQGAGSIFNYVYYILQYPGKKMGAHGYTDTKSRVSVNLDLYFILDFWMSFSNQEYY